MSKRESTDAEVPVKRQKLDGLSEEGPVTQKDVVYFQKEAIYRQLTLYKSKLNILQRDYSSLQSTYQDNKKKLFLLNQWIDQVLDLDNDSSSSNLDDFLVNIEGLEDDEYNHYLGKKKQLITKLISKINSSSIEPNIGLNKKLHELKLKYDLVSTDLANKSTSFDELLNDHQQLLKSFERVKSVTIPRVLGESRKEEVKEEIKTEEIKEDQENGAIKSPQLKESQDNEKIEDLQSQINELNSQISQYRTLIEDQKKKFDQSIENLQPISKDNDQDQLSLITKQNQELTSKQIEYIQKLELLEVDLKQERERTSTTESNLKEFNDAKLKLSNELIETKKNEERLRNQRDLLTTEIDILKKKTSTWATVENLKELIKSQEQMIKNFDFEEKLNTLEISKNNQDVESLQKKSTLLLDELKEIEQAFKQLQSIRIPKIFSAVEEEERKKHLEILKVKLDAKYKILLEGEKYQDMKKVSIENSFKVLQKNYDSLNSSQSEYKSQILNLNNELNDLKKIGVQKELEVKSIQSKYQSLQDSYKKSTNSVTQLKEDFTNITKEHSKLVLAESIKDKEISTLKSQLNQTTKQLEVYKANPTSALSQDIEEYRSFMLCSLCSKNVKDTALKTCGHVFCESCADDRLKARMRKCPNCNKPFNANDLLTVHY